MEILQKLWKYIEVSLKKFWADSKAFFFIMAPIITYLLINEFFNEKELATKLEDDSQFSRVVIDNVRLVPVGRGSPRTVIDFHYITTIDTLYSEYYLQYDDLESPFSVSDFETAEHLRKMKLVIQYAKSDPSFYKIRFDLVCKYDCYGWIWKSVTNEIPSNMEIIKMPRPYDLL